MVEASHQQADARYDGASRGIQCSCIPLMSNSWDFIETSIIYHAFGIYMI